MLTTDYILLRRLRMKIDLIPGPPHGNSTLYNQAIQVIARYPAAEAAVCFTSTPNTTVVTDGSKDPRAWQWLWSAADRTIRLNFTILAKQLGATNDWGGSTLEADCYIGDLVGFWAHFRQTHPDTWLHYDGRVYTPDTFIEKIRDMLESRVITDIL